MRIVCECWPLIDTIGLQHGFATVSPPILVVVVSAVTVVAVRRFVSLCSAGSSIFTIVTCCGSVCVCVCGSFYTLFSLFVHPSPKCDAICSALCSYICISFMASTGSTRLLTVCVRACVAVCVRVWQIMYIAPEKCVMVCYDVIIRYRLFFPISAFAAVRPPMFNLCLILITVPRKCSCATMNFRSLFLYYVFIYGIHIH